MENKVKVWLAREDNGILYMSKNKPQKYNNGWFGGGDGISLGFNPTLFPNIKWGDDEPTEAYITLVEPQEQPVKEIDWEQRMVKIAESIFVTEQPYINCEEDVEKYAKIAIQRAKILIDKLKEQSE